MEQNPPSDFYTYSYSPSEFPQNYLSNTDSFPNQNYQSSLFQSSDVSKIKIMEKDKTIFEYSKTIKENENLIESLKRTIAQKEEENQKMKMNIQDIIIQLKQYENTVIKNNDTIKKMQSEFEEKIAVAQEEKQEMLRKNIELENILTDRDENIKEFYIKNENIFQEKEELVKALEERRGVIVKYEKILEHLKNDNKQIPSLKRQLEDCGNVINQLKIEILNLKEQKEQLTFEKDEINKKINELSQDKDKEKIKDQTIFKLNYEYDQLKKDFTQKEKDNLSLKEKYSSTLKNNDELIYLVTNEIGEFTNYLNGLNFSTRTLMKLPIKRAEFSTQEKDDSFSSKYDAIMKNINTLRVKVIEIINSSLSSINKLYDEIEVLENNKNKISQEKDNIDKNNILKDHKINELESMNKDYQNSLDALNESYTQLKDNYVKLKNIYQEFTEKNEKIAIETSDFVNALRNKLQKNSTKTPLTFKEILSKLEYIITEKEKMAKHISELNTLNEKYKKDLYKLNSDNSQLKSKNDTLLRQTTEEIERINNQKDNEIKEQKDTFYEKVKSLKVLLEESNQLILSYENKVTDLQEKKAKLERNLKMLTNSHIELEQSINNNNNSVNVEMEEKMKKYNSLLRELELKDIHIKSLEKLVNNQNELHEQQEQREQNENVLIPKSNFVGKIVSSKSFNQQKEFISDSLNNSKCSNTSIFVKNEEKEQELRKLMNCFNKGEINNNIFEIQDNEQIRNTDENNNSGSNLKIPGKLYKKNK